MRDVILKALYSKRDALTAAIEVIEADSGMLFAEASPQQQLTANGRRGGRRKGFKMSVEARAKIAEAARKRWAAQKEGKAAKRK